MDKSDFSKEILDDELLSGALDGAQADYQAKRSSVKIGRELSFSDAELEESLGIKLKAGDRAKTIITRANGE
jgi:hypothetical protein